jgi:methyltransferase (TIGR00027 family)
MSSEPPSPRDWGTERVDASIKDVSDTALWVATYRAIETERTDALFRDPLAAPLVGERGRRIVEHMKSGRPVQWVVVIRTCIIDDFITAAIAEGVDTVVNLGAGLDTRPYRMDLPASLRWVEVDYPHLIEFKNARLADEKPHCELERIGLDLADLPARQELFARINDAAKKVLVLTEGVTPYLSNEEAGSLADDLRQNARFERWVVDYVSSQWALKFRHRRTTRDLKNAPLKFYPPDWNAFFAEHGWTVKDIRYYGDEGHRLKRPYRMPWWMKLMFFFASRERREKLRTAAGFAVLAPFSG